MRIGPVELATIDEWEPPPGSVVSWHPTPASFAKAQQAPISDVPPSYIQARHLRSLVEQAARGLDHSRLLIAVCKVNGRCDVRAMTYVINAHLRRHDTYRSWFDYVDDDHIVRHSIADPADIEFAPTRHGEMTSAELRDLVVSTPDSLHWDCFRFGIIQSADHFTFYASMDHLHADGRFVGLGLMEFQMMYAALISGAPPVQLPDAGSYEDYCVRQRRDTSALTLDSPEVGAWIEFAENNDGTFPDFPLPLGDRSQPCAGDLVATTLMDSEQTHRFEVACVDAGTRFIGGLLACIALATHELTGAETYYGLTPIDTRSTTADQTTQGWYTGLIPVTVPIVATSFAETARAAQESFDSGIALAHVPFERVVELAPWLSKPQPLFPMLNFFDAAVGPLAPLLNSLSADVQVAAYSDGRITYPLNTLVGRFDETGVTVMFPKNPVARESVSQYLATFKAACARVADGRGAEPLRNLIEVPR
ncbi:condensation domain-containing protein [Mycobacterium hubeiense]|uniref:condensation domain-containing protein n=1 Tax=Mycobacterium hubeiense TaxID=1867256 RepID=UPI000C7F4B1F|nr:condensation domain-containing protein [Mycobacterium sp. QGD 101]